MADDAPGVNKIFMPHKLAWERKDSNETLSQSSTHERVFNNAKSVGRCSLCGDITLVSPAHNFVSQKFTGWDLNTEKTASETQHLWCEPCVWCFTNRAGRTAIFVVADSCATADRNTPEFLSTERKIVELLASPLPQHTAISFPFSGKKHTMPYMRAAHVSTDAGVFLWGAREASLWSAIREYSRFVALPATATQLFATAPSTRGLSAEDTVKTYRAYSSLQSRTDDTFLPVVFAMAKTLMRQKPPTTYFLSCSPHPENIRFRNNKNFL